MHEGVQLHAQSCWIQHRIILHGAGTVPHGVQMHFSQLMRVCIFGLVSWLPMLQQQCKALRQFCDTQHAASLAAMCNALQHMYSCTLLTAYSVTRNSVICTMVV